MIPSIVHKTGELPNITLLPNSPKESATDFDSLASDKYKSIKAFRTITTMLHHIPSQHEISVVDMPLPRHDPEKDKRLKLLNALATLLVRSDEVAAVAVTKRDVGSGDIQVIACHHNVGSYFPNSLCTILLLVILRTSWLPSIHAKTIKISYPNQISHPSWMQRSTCRQTLKKKPLISG